jgi:exosome complex component RRP46
MHITPDTHSNVPSPPGPRERHLERLVDSTLRSVILTHLIPRTLVQITLQVRTLPDEDSSSGVNTSLTLLPHLLHTAYLALLSASIPLATTLTSVLVAFPAAGSQAPLLAPTANELLRARPIRSAHVFAFSGDRRLLLNESDGTLTHAEWTDACEAAEDVCCAEDADDGGVPLDGMDVDGQAQQGLNLDRWLRDVATRKVAHEQRWKAGA